MAAVKISYPPVRLTPPLPEITPPKAPAPLVTVSVLDPRITEPAGPPDSAWIEAPDLVAEMSKVPSAVT